ncbi:hypothetical protein [Helicobacter sp. T3_23-1056]
MAIHKQKNIVILKRKRSISKPQNVSRDISLTLNMTKKYPSLRASETSVAIHTLQIQKKHIL